MRRIVEMDQELKKSVLDTDLLILSNYFCSKKDPQRDIYQTNGDFNYISNWYYSVIENGILAIIFHDGLKKEFIQKYQKNNIKFVKCDLGEYSLNDERFFVFEEFLNYIPSKTFVLTTDINDVIINKTPLALFKENPDKIFIGRGDKLTWGRGIWTLGKMKEFYNNSNSKIDSDILCFPVFNAGLIGGQAGNLLKLFGKMIQEFSYLPSRGNFNMAVLNYVLYTEYYPKRNYFFSLLSFNFCYRLNKSLNNGRLRFFGGFYKKDLEKKENGICSNKKIYSGFPFNSMFRKFEIKGKSESYLIHK